MGEFQPALAAEARAHAIGEAVGDRHLQSLASWTTGIIHAFLGEWGSGIAACRHALDWSPDPFNTAIAQGWLGYAFLEKGDAAQAIPLLEQSVLQLGQFHFPQFLGWFTAFLADAHALGGQPETARDLAARALAITRSCGFLYGTGCAQRAVGRSAWRRGQLAEAEAALGDAARTFASVHARHELARTHLDLAAVAQAGARPDGASRHLDEAHSLFAALNVPQLVSRARGLARDLKLALSDPPA